MRVRARLDNCFLYIYDGCNSTQILISNGAYDTQTGPWCNLSASETKYIWMHIETSNSGISCVYAYLEIKVPNSSTYILRVITFEMI